MSRDFNGATDRIDWASVADLTGSAFTISAWIYHDTQTTIDYIFEIHQSGNLANGIWFYCTTSGEIGLIRAGSTNLEKGVNVDLVGSWHHVLVTHDGVITTSSSIHFYVDGTENTDIDWQVNGAGELAPTGSWSIGGRIFDDNRNWDGKIAEVAVWNRVLASEEITGLAGGKTPEFYSSNLLFYYSAKTDTTTAETGGAAATVDGTTYSADHPAVNSPSLSISPSPSISRSRSVSPSVSPSISRSASVSPSISGSASISRSASASPSISRSASVSPSVSGSASASRSISGSASVSPSVSGSASVSPSVSLSISGSPSVSLSISESVSASPSVSGSASVSPSVSWSASVSLSISGSASESLSVSLSASVSPSISRSASESPSVSASVSPSISASSPPVVTKLVKQVALFVGPDATRANTAYATPAWHFPWLYTSANYDGTVEIYFEAVLSITDTYTAYCELYNGSTQIVELNTTQTTPTRVRSADIASSLVNGTAYYPRIKSSNASGTTTLYAARLIIIQTGTITKTETVIDLGSNDSQVYTSYQECPNKGHVHWDTSEWDGVSAVYYESFLGPLNATATAYSQLAKTDGTAVSGSEVSRTGATTESRERSSDIKAELVSGTTYRVDMKTDNASYACRVRCSRLIVVQSSFTKTVTVYPIVPNQTASSTSEATRYAKNYWDNDEWDVFNKTVTIVGTIVNAGGTVTVSFELNDGISDVSTVTHNSSTKTRVEGSSFTPADNSTYDGQTVTSSSIGALYLGHIWVNVTLGIISGSASLSPSPSLSLSPSVSPSISPSASISLSASASPSVSYSASVSPSISPSVSPSVSPSISPSASASPSLSRSASVSPSISGSASASPSVSPSASVSPSISGSPSASPSISYSPSVSPSISPSVSASVSPSASISPSVSASISPSMPIGEVCWGHVTGVLEDNVRTFSGNWTGTGSISGSGDAEVLCVDSGETMESEVVETGAVTITLLQNVYAVGDTITINYRHGATEAACLSAGWNLYTGQFVSLGFVQVQVAY